MKANPGGSIAAENIVGRDRLVKRLWHTLEQQSLILVAERRIGKSSVIRKMQDEEPDNILTVARDVENIQTPLEFVERVYHDVEKHLSRKRRTAGRARQLLKEIAGTEVGGLFKLPAAAAPHWKSLLEKTIEDLIEHQECTVVLFWDEFPWMLQKIKKALDETAAMEILDTLRCLRQTHEELRMVFTGSIGLHHVVGALTEAGHTHDTLNDMRIIEVSPLADDDARDLASELLRGEALRCEDLDSTAQCIAQQVDCNPYYIHSVVATLKDSGDSAESGTVERLVAEALVDPQDRWHLNHYRERLDEYYGAERVPVVLALLDLMAASEHAMSFDQMLTGLAAHLDRHSGETAKRILAGDRELLRRVLTLLQSDHYLAQRVEDGALTFRFPLIKRWWRLHRNLTT